jgi:hypothetical protein
MMNLKKDFESAKASKNWPQTIVLVKTLAMIGTYLKHDMNDCIQNMQSFENAGDWIGADQLFNQMLETTGGDNDKYTKTLQDIMKNQTNNLKP